MSIDLVAACLWLDMEAHRKLVLLSLCENADQDGDCFPSVQYIAARASLSERRARDHLQALEDEGWVTTTGEGGGRGKTADRRVNVAQIEDAGQARKEAFKAVRLRGVKGDDTSGFRKRRMDETSAKMDETSDSLHITEPSVEPSASLSKKNSYPRSDDSDKDRAPDALVERWLIKEMSSHFGAKIVQRQLERCELFFVWRKIKQYVDDGDRATLKELMPRAQAEYQVEIREIVRYHDSTSDAADTPEERDRNYQIAEMYRHIAVTGKAQYDAEYAAWEQETYPVVNGSQ